MLDTYPDLFKDKRGLMGNGSNSGANSSKVGENCDITSPIECEKAQVTTKAHENQTLMSPHPSSSLKKLRTGKEESQSPLAPPNLCPNRSAAAVDPINYVCRSEPASDSGVVSMRRSRRKPVPSRRFLDFTATARHRNRSASPSHHRRRSTAPSHLHH